MIAMIQRRHWRAAVATLAMLAFCAFAMRVVLVWNSKTELGNSATSPNGQYTGRYHTTSIERLLGGRSYSGYLEILDTGQRVSYRELTESEASGFNAGGSTVHWSTGDRFVTFKFSRHFVWDAREEIRELTFDTQKRQWEVFEHERFRK